MWIQPRCQGLWKCLIKQHATQLRINASIFNLSTDKEYTDETLRGRTCHALTNQKPIQTSPEGTMTFLEPLTLLVKRFFLKRESEKENSATNWVGKKHSEWHKFCWYLIFADKSCCEINDKKELKTQGAECQSPDLSNKALRTHKIVLLMSHWWPL